MNDEAYIYASKIKVDFKGETKDLIECVGSIVEAILVVYGEELGAKILGDGIDFAINKNQSGEALKVDLTKIKESIEKEQI